MTPRFCLTKAHVLLGVAGALVAAGWIARLGAVDSSGAPARPVRISIVIGPTAKPTPRLLLFAPPADDAANATSYRLEIFVAGVDPKNASPVKSVDLRKPAAVNGEISVDLTEIAATMPAGRYFASVTVIKPKESASMRPPEPLPPTGLRIVSPGAKP